MLAFAQYEGLLYSAKQGKLVFLSSVHGVPEEPAVCLICVVYQKRDNQWSSFFFFSPFLFKWRNLKNHPSKSSQNPLSGMK